MPYGILEDYRMEVVPGTVGLSTIEPIMNADILLRLSSVIKKSCQRISEA